MPYIKTNWIDRAVQFANRFIIADAGGGKSTITADPGIVTQAGTPLSAANLNKIEQGIADAYGISNKPHVTGAYTGNGAASRFINLGFTPTAVDVRDALGRTYTAGGLYGGVAITGSNATMMGDIAVDICANGFNVHYSSYSYTNAADTTYKYIAFK